VLPIGAPALERDISQPSLSFMRKERRIFRTSAIDEPIMYRLGMAHPANDSTHINSLV